MSFLPTNFGFEELRLSPIWRVSANLWVCCCGASISPIQSCHSDSGFWDLPTVGWDLSPTFCELAGIARGLPNRLEGMSLKSLFETGIAGSEEMTRQIAFHYPHYSQAGPQSTITQGGFKLIKFYDTDTSKLFDLTRGISEQNDLSQQQPGKAKKMHQALMNY